jgi:bifunctional non-homologous end joining protein LigD
MRQRPRPDDCSARAVARISGPLATNSAGRFVRPCESTLVDRPPAGPGWLHEVKHHGFRVLVRKLGERAKVWSQRGADFTDRFLGIAEGS